MTKLKLFWSIITIWLVQADGIKINSCDHTTLNDSDCSTKVYIPNGGLKGLPVGPEFVVEGYL